MVSRVGRACSTYCKAVAAAWLAPLAPHCCSPRARETRARVSLQFVGCGAAGPKVTMVCRPMEMKNELVHRGPRRNRKEEITQTMNEYGFAKIMV